MVTFSTFSHVLRWGKSIILLRPIFTTDLLSKKPKRTLFIFFSCWCNFDDWLYLIVPKRKLAYFCVFVHVHTTIEVAPCFARGAFLLWCSNSSKCSVSSKLIKHRYSVERVKCEDMQWDKITNNNAGLHACMVACACM